MKKLLIILIVFFITSCGTYKYRNSEWVASVRNGKEFNVYRFKKSTQVDSLFLSVFDIVIDSDKLLKDTNPPFMQVDIGHIEFYCQKWK
ncbi:MAG: hypothetical protein ACOC2U_00200 [bacterium]